MKRIMIIGCPGSGKTTLSKFIADKFGLPLVHIDKLNWKSGSCFERRIWLKTC